MKYLKNMTLVALATLLTTTAIAQKNVVRLGLGGLAVSNFNFDAERALTDNQSLSLNLGILFPSEIPNVLQDNISDLNFDKISGISIAPEYRFYTGSKKALNGFYLAPYLKYSSYSIGGTGSYEDVTGGIDANLSTLGGGLQLGTQWLIKDRVSIDWSFFGIGINRNTIDLQLQSNDAGINFEETTDDLRGSMNDLPPFITERINTESGSDYARIKVRVPFLALRSSLSIGIAF